MGILGVFLIFILLNLFLVGATREGRGRPRVTPTPPNSPTATPPSQTTFLGGDALTIPADIQQLERNEAAARPTGGQAPGWDRTSDFMVGSVAVAIILPNCDGTLAPCTQAGWTTNDINHVVNEIQIALDWWEQKAAEAGVGSHLSFQLTSDSPRLVTTGYEPIEIPGGNNVLCGDEGVWIDDLMANMGYDDFSGGNTYLMEVRQFNNDLRDQYDTDWAFTIFVADASHDSDGLFGNVNCGGISFGVAAWAYLAGPFVGMNTVNNGFGYNFIDGVAAHEIGHIFGAPDESPSNHCQAPPNLPSCTTPFGYLGFENQNCGANVPLFSCGLSEGNSLMTSPQGSSTGINQSVIHQFTVGHVGWFDSDGDTIPDPIDTIPVHTLTPPTNPNADRTFTGSAQDIPWPSALPTSESWRPAYPDVTINEVVSVQYRVDNGGWAEAQPQDGSFDTSQEDYFFEPLICESGVYTVDVRAINSVGNSSTIISETINVTAPENCSTVNLPLVMNGSGGSMMAPPSNPLPPGGYPVPTPMPSPTPGGYP
ncbi:hypothetical protein [Candidatus Leptofilum sp.]|uniref:hypothetical protein n=1 Tax=Candidatus Leptofilum sp. TaxID=3241576 RepID=UPI003B596E44